MGLLDEIKASPRNSLLGAIADGLGGASKFVSKNNPPVEMILGLLGVPGVTNTLNELSYGGALGTGSGMTWKPKADTMDALMTAAPIAAAAPRLINSGAAAVGKRVAPAVESLVNSTMQRGGTGSNFLRDMSQGTQSPLTVWHGSPHKFDKFDASKIGTGEGAQAYGHGLYLAESPDVARTYTTSTNHVAKQDWVQLDGVPYRATQTRAEDTAHNVAADALSRFDYDKKAAMGWLENYGRDLEAKKIIKSTKKFGPTNDPATSMYKVDLPDDQIAKMLDWDKPLSKQPKNVRDAYKKYLQSPQASEHAKAWTRYSEGMRLDQAEPLLKNPGGENLYKNAFPSREAANQWASENGIPGIRYLDGGSRGAGQGSSNFVVFPGNEGLLSILERNGQQI